MGKALTEKEILLLQEYFRTGNQIKAFKTVYPERTDQQAYHHASNKIKSCLAKLKNNEIYDFSNIGMGRVFSKVNELLDCGDKKVQLGTLQLLTKLLGMGVETQNTNNESTETVDTINIVDEVTIVESEEE